MSAIQLIREFSQRETLPVDIQEVVDFIVARGVKDEIYYFWDHNLRQSILRGYIKHEEYPQPAGPPHRVAEITYGKLGDDWERLVCCKELLHLLEPIESRVTKLEEVEKLIEKIILPPDLVDPFTDGLHAATDRVAVAHAIAALFPFAARGILLPKYNNGLTLADVSVLAELPPRYVAIVMSDSWPEIHAMILSERE